MIIVFKKKCVPDVPHLREFPVYEAGVGYEVGVSISQEQADNYIADGSAVVVGQQEKKKGIK